MATAAAPGPVFDNSLRLLARRDLVRVCDWLGLPTHESTLHLAESLPAATQQVDLLTEIGPQSLAHVEFERAPRRDLAHRMLEYRTRIMNLYPGYRITQRVVVLAHGAAPDTVLDPPQLTFQLDVTYLRNEDPEILLTDPSLAPLAALARAGNQHQRIDILRRALTLITTVNDRSRRHDLLYCAATLAGIHLDPATIKELTTEAGMPITLDEDTVAGRVIAATAEARGEARGETRGRARTLAGLMRRTFGDDPRIDTLAEHLAQLPEEKALDAALEATTIDELAALIRT